MKWWKCERWLQRTLAKRFTELIHIYVFEKNSIWNLALVTTPQRSHFEGIRWNLLHVSDIVLSGMNIQDRFIRLAKNSHIPPRQSPDYSKAVRQRHAAILGICALVDSYPYTVEKWLPELLTNVLSEHTYDPVSLRNCINDTWLIGHTKDPYIHHCEKMRQQL
jgi:hypothetical protein